MSIPVIDLVGKNARLRGGIYTDKYMTALNEFATVDKIFGANREAIANGKRNLVLNLITTTNTSGHLGRPEYEKHLLDFVMTAAKAGEWRAIKLGIQHAPGLDAVVEEHFGYVTVHKGKAFLLPSALYLIYCKEQLSA